MLNIHDGVSWITGLLCCGCLLNIVLGSGIMGVMDATQWQEKSYGNLGANCECAFGLIEGILILFLKEMDKLQKYLDVVNENTERVIIWK